MTRTPYPKRFPKGSHYFGRLQFISDVELVACLESNWSRYDLSTGIESDLHLPTRERPSNSLVHPSGRFLKIAREGRPVATLALTEDGIAIWCEDTGPNLTYPQLISFDPDGTRYFAVVITHRGQVPQLFDTATDKLIATFVGNGDSNFPEYSWAIAPNRRTAFAAAKRAILSFDYESGGPPALSVLLPGASVCHAVACHPGGRIVATVEDHRTVTFRDADTLQPIRTYDFNMPKVTCVAFTPDGTRCVVGNSRGKVLLFDVDE